MNRYLLLYALAATGVIYLLINHYHTENERLSANHSALIASYRQRLDSLHASGEVLRLRCREFEALNAASAERIRQLGIRLRRVEAAASTTTRQELKIAAPIRDTVFIQRRDTQPVLDSAHHFCWRDPWVEIEGCITPDTLHCRLRSIDTLHQVVHRIPRRFLFFRWGTKALRQEIRSSNPHTKIVYSEYVIIER